MSQHTATQTQNNDTHHESFEADINNPPTAHSLSDGVGHIVVHETDVERAALSRKGTYKICDDLAMSVQTGAWRDDHE
jgi:hypothetical protein